MRLLSLLLLSCAKPKAPEPPPAAPPPPPPPPAWATDLLSAMDPTANPCEDFYQYACGGWIATTPLPADKPVWGRSFSVIRDRNVTALHAIVERAAKDPAAGDAEWAKMGAYYGSCMDTAALDAAGVAPLKPYLDDISKVKDQKSFMAAAGRLNIVGAGAMVGAWIDGDYKDPKTSILYLSQGGISLPDRDYYQKTDPDSVALLSAYETHVDTMLGFLGTTGQGKAVVAFEKAIAEVSVPRADLRDPDKTYNKIDRVGLVKLTKNLSWEDFLRGMEVTDATAISVETPEVFKKLEGIVKKADKATLRAYLQWQLIHALATQLDQPVYDAHFAFFGKQVVGQKEPEPRWKRCSQATDAAMGDITGKYYVKERFPGDSKEIALSLITNVESAFEAGLPSLAWMDDTTRERAVGKMKKITNKIGYPDPWRNYDALPVAAGKHVENVVAARTFEHRRNIVKIGNPADRNEWYMSAPTVNAYYNATLNEMVFPAGILQAPFFDRAFPAAMNYGAIGMVMGHELSHGFDDQGRKFDGDGKMSEWWQPEVVGRYQERAACVQKQYDGYQVGDLSVNGALTLGENIADLGGIRLTHHAWKAQHKPESPASVQGLTDEQLLFVAFAQGWCQVASPQWEKMLVLSNPHSPAKYRVNGPLSNAPEFHGAFSCAEGTKMKPADRCEVW